MAEQFETVLKDAFSLIGSFEAESQIETVDAELAVRTFNRMMDRFVREGIDLNYTEINSLDDYITVPDASIEGLTYNLALRLAPHYVGAGPSDALVGLAKSGKRALMVLGRTPIQLKYPSSLPMGSGNRNIVYDTDAFYTDSIPHPVFSLSQLGTTITIAASATPTKIDSGWSEKTLRGFSTDGTGEAIFDKEDRFFKVDVSFFAKLASGTDDCSFYIYRNGEQRAMSLVQKELNATTYTKINLTWITQLKHGGTIEVYCQNDDEAVDIILNSGGSFLIR